MPGDPSFAAVHSYVTAAPAPDTSAMSSRSPGHFGFVVWLAILGVVLPVIILGGLQVGGFSFVFKHR